MIAWQHIPGQKHVVYMSHNSYDYNGNEFFDTRKFPEKIMFHKTEQHEFLEKNNQFTDLNYINNSRHGTFQDTGKVHSIPQDVDRIIYHIKNNGIKKLLLHFHGGLISENMGMKSAETFCNNFVDSKDTHVVSIVWETGFLEALPETFKRILQTDELLRRLIAKVVKLLGAKLGVDLTILDNRILPHSIENYANLIQSSTINLSEDDLVKAFREYKRNIESELELQNIIYNELQEISEDEDLTEDDFNRIYKDDSENEAKFINPKILWYTAKIAKRCIIRFLNKRDHGVWPTIIEEACREIYLDDFGIEIWNVMKFQAEDMWVPNDRATGLNQFAGRYLLDKLVQNFSNTDLEIHVVAHIAGAVAARKWVATIKSDNKYKSFKFKNLIFLAPACRCDLFKDTVMKHQETFDNFRMFTMDDEYERTDNLIPFPVLGLLYTRSLLYLISGILEGKNANEADAFILGLHRHIRKNHPYSKESILNEISDFLMLPQNNVNRLILSKSTEIEGRKSTAVKHGGFAKDIEIVNSIKYMLQ
ncbi:hypothetical protein [Flavobacterium yafengii]|uniref:Alpha/beta hydrolase n=1 Tax=Flavobacterium yafengii TaxID=3041253 RepID=A0AAW6TPK0_9FLAO|nr:hypothetical protein [Flavobacterium yafengii]MDI5950386.1 hypothetical protein [Flavobacterium yafengii]